MIAILILAACHPPDPDGSKPHDTDTPTVRTPTPSPTTPTPTTPPAPTGTTPAPCQRLEWVIPVQGTDVEDLFDLAPRTSTTFVAGGRGGTSTTLGLDAAGEPVLLGPTVGGGDGIVGVWALDGESVWVRTIGSAFNDRVQGVAASPTGAVAAVGDIDLEATVRGGAVEVPLPHQYSADGFVVAFDADGEVTATGSLLGDSNEYLEDVAFDAAGNVYAAGTFDSVEVQVTGRSSSQTLHDGDPTEQSRPDELVVASWDPTGELRWAQAFTGKNTDQSNDLLVDGDRVYFMTFMGGTEIRVNGTSPSGPHVLGPSLVGFVWQLSTSDGSVLSVAPSISDGGEAESFIGRTGGDRLVFGSRYGLFSIDGVPQGRDGVISVFVDRMDGPPFPTPVAGTGTTVANGGSPSEYGTVFTAGGLSDVTLGAGTPAEVSFRFDDKLQDTFVATYDETGGFLCAWAAYGNQWERFTDAFVDSAGGVIAIGYWPSPGNELILERGQPEELHLQGTLSDDAFIVRYAPVPVE